MPTVSAAWSTQHRTVASWERNACTRCKNNCTGLCFCCLRTSHVFLFFVTSNFEFVIVFYTRQSIRSCDRIIITLALFLYGASQRYTWHEYIMAQMTAVSQTGKPVNRPLWFDFPHDPMTWDITTSYMFGDTMLVAPVTDAAVSVQTAYVVPCTLLSSLLFLYVHACIVDCFFPKLLFVFFMYVYDVVLSVGFRMYVYRNDFVWSQRDIDACETEYVRVFDSLLSLWKKTTLTHLILLNPLLLSSARLSYLPIVPSGSHWRHIWTNKTFPGGANATVPAPLGDVPIWELTSTAPM